MNKRKMDVGDRRFATRAGVSFRSALIAFFVFFAAAALLNGRHLHEAASRRPFGPVRTAWMIGTAPLNRVTVTLGLDRLRELFDRFQDTQP